MNDPKSNSTPESTLTTFMTAWHARQWGTCHRHTTETWQASPYARRETLRVIEELKIFSFEILDTIDISAVMVDVMMRVRWSPLIEHGRIARGFKRTRTILDQIITARLIREEAAFTPSESGRWGVNPLSLSRREDVANLSPVPSS